MSGVKVGEPIHVVAWVGYDTDAPDAPVGGFGGWFREGHRWKDYLEEFDVSVHPYLEALRKSIVALGIWESGDWHQGTHGGDGFCPKFSDGTVARYTFRAWGDLLAAVWSTHYDRDQHYMDFYMMGTSPRPPDLVKNDLG